MIEPGAREEFQRFLERQRADYVLALPLKLAEVESLWGAVAKGAAVSDELARLIRAAHSLAGSGAVFGFEELGASGKSLELLLQRLAESPEGPQGKAAAAIEESIAHLRSCAPTPG
jgi:HPt (histidine-containing phosphotransfer) domain-containing protein